MNETEMQKKSTKSGYWSLWRLGLLFGIISLILSFAMPLYMIYTWLSMPGFGKIPMTVVISPYGYFSFGWYLTPVFVSLGIIFVSLAGLKNSEKKIGLESK